MNTNPNTTNPGDIISVAVLHKAISQISSMSPGLECEFSFGIEQPARRALTPHEKNLLNEEEKRALFLPRLKITAVTRRTSVDCTYSFADLTPDFDLDRFLACHRERLPAPEDRAKALREKADQLRKEAEELEAATFLPAAVG